MINILEKLIHGFLISENVTLIKQVKYLEVMVSGFHTNSGKILTRVYHLGYKKSLFCLNFEEV